METDTRKELGKVEARQRNKHLFFLENFSSLDSANGRRIPFFVLHVIVLSHIIRSHTRSNRGRHWLKAPSSTHGLINIIVDKEVFLSNFFTSSFRSSDAWSFTNLVALTKETLLIESCHDFDTTGNVKDKNK